MSPSDLFAEIYSKNRWGGSPGEYCSGPGSSEPYASPYCDLIRKFLSDLQGPVTLVDLGCGDFKIGRQILANGGADLHYVGVDLVPGLIAMHRAWLCTQANLGPERVRFVLADLTQDDLPPGDVCLLRQVLQHLSNRQIVRILPKLRRYRYILVTEHLPSDGTRVRPNLDMPHGPDVRLRKRSGVYLDQPPFNVRSATELLSLDDSERGCYKTYLIRGEDVP